MSLLAATILSALAGTNAWSRKAISEKSDLPREEMPLNPTEIEVLGTLSGKEKRDYIKKLKEKYENC